MGNSWSSILKFTTFTWSEAMASRACTNSSWEHRGTKDKKSRKRNKKERIFNSTVSTLSRRTSIVMRMETAAINASLEAIIEFDKPSLTSRIVSPLWCNPSTTKGFVQRLLGSKNTPEKIDLFVAPEQIAACSGAGSFCTKEAQWACNRTWLRFWKGYASLVRSSRTTCGLPIRKKRTRNIRQCEAGKPKIVAQPRSISLTKLEVWEHPIGQLHLRRFKWIFYALSHKWPRRDLDHGLWRGLPVQHLRFSSISIGFLLLVVWGEGWKRGRCRPWGWLPEIGRVFWTRCVALWATDHLLRRGVCGRCEKRRLGACIGRTVGKAFPRLALVAPGIFKSFLSIMLRHDMRTDPLQHLLPRTSFDGLWVGIDPEKSRPAISSSGLARPGKLGCCITVVCISPSASPVEGQFYRSRRRCLLPGVNCEVGVTMGFANTGNTCWTWRVPGSTETFLASISAEGIAFQSRRNDECRKGWMVDLQEGGSWSDEKEAVKEESGWREKVGKVKR